MKLPLCGLLSLTSVDGVYKGLTKHQLVGNFTMDVDEFGLGKQHTRVKNAYPEERARSFPPGSPVARIIGSL